MTKPLHNSICVALLLAGTLHASNIVAPALGTTLAPGATVTVKVAPSSGEQISSAAVIIIGGATVDAVPSTTVAGAYEAQIKIPTTSVGPTLIMSYSTRPDGSASMDFVNVLVEPGQVQSLSTSTPYSLSFVGATYQLSVKALFADGITRDVTFPEQGTTYASSNDAVLGVNANGEIQARTNGTAILTITNRGQSLAQTIPVMVPDPPTNHIPVANPGPDQGVPPQTLVTLSAAASSDADGDPLTYTWQQQAGRTVFLRTPTAQQTTFVAPNVSSAEVLTFSLVVSDNKNATTFPALVHVTVDPALTPPPPGPPQ